MKRRIPKRKPKQWKLTGPDEEKTDAEISEDTDEEEEFRNPGKKPKRLHNAKEIEL